MREPYPFKEECYNIIGCAMEVHNELGHGFLEAVYQEALALIFLEKGVPFQKEKILDIIFRGKLLNKKYIADFICYDEIIIELKATEGLCDSDTSQVLNYLKATGKTIGLLLNFGTPRLQTKRIIL